MRSNDLVSFFRKAIAPIKRQVSTSILRGIIKLTKEAAKIQQIQVESFEDDIRDEVEKFHNFGFKSYAPTGSECLMFSVAGNSEHLIAIGSEHRETLKELPILEEGDTIIYTKEKKYLHFKKKNIEISLEKIKIENDDNELITVLSDLVDQLRKSKWNTAIGPQPIFESDGVKLDEIKEKMDSFKI